ncbi:MAG: HlyD family efflux transporter periplasmic adaptor subunit [OM182 bacterium]|nr:MAG: HlyD family efflux transporter periplasmic adaptor subunit [OM182 bacterium]
MNTLTPTMPPQAPAGINQQDASRSLSGPWWSSSSLLLFAGLATFFGWAAYFEIDQSVRATGEVIPTARNQRIQVADGGILAELLVSEGQYVDAGQRLAVLEKDRARAAFEESRARVAALRIALVRAQAEAQQRPPSYSGEVAEHPEFVAAQLQLYQQRRRALDESLALAQESLSLAQRQLNINQRLFETQDVSQLDVMSAQSKVADVRSRVVDLTNTYLNEALEEVALLEGDLALAEQQFNEKQNILFHTDVVAPVEGVIKFLNFNTLGAVVRPGEDLLEISPSTSELVVEVKIDPADVAQLTKGLPVSIALDAFDPTIFGRLQGELLYLSSDTLQEQGPDGRSMTFYRARVRLNQEANKDNARLAGAVLRPGMTATVDIRTAKRTVLHYLSKPILRGFSGALTER